MLSQASSCNSWEFNVQLDSNSDVAPVWCTAGLTRTALDQTLNIKQVTPLRTLSILFSPTKMCQTVLNMFKRNNCTLFSFLGSQYIKQYNSQKYNQLFTAIVGQEDKPANMAASGYVMCPKTPGTSLWRCQNCLLSFNNPGVSSSV